MSLARPYRDFLTPALHKRFTSAALLTLGICYVEAIWFGQWDIFWQWFPFGPAGIRTLLLFTSVLCVFILRIAQLRVGPRTTTSQFNTFLQYTLNTPFQIVNTLVWYCLSAYIFSEVYIWSSSPEMKLAMVDEGKSYERSKLNERPLYLRSVFVFFGVAQAVWHLYKDYDRVSFPKTPLELGAAQQGQGIKAVLSKKIDDVQRLTMGLAARLLTSIVGSSIVYGFFLRQSIWSWTFMFASTWHSLPKNSRYGSLTGVVLSLLTTSVWNGTLLLLTWESANLVFDAYVAQAPLKNGSVLTDSSTDPNHSLVAGLKAKKEVTRNFAFWELLLITQNMEGRRRLMFRDINRPGGSIWSALLTVCLGEVHAMTKRIQDFQQASSPTPANAPPGQQPQQQQQQPGQLSQLPRITAPLKQDNIFTAPPAPRSRYEKAEQQLALTTKAAAQALVQPPPNGQPPPDPLKPLREPAMKLIGQGANTMFSQETQQTIVHPVAPINSVFTKYLLQILQSPIGIPFRETFSKRATAIVLGAPYGANTPLLAATSALSQLAISSLKEDEYGTVSKDVASIIRTFTYAESAVVRFMGTLPTHWTDVGFNEQRPGARVVEDVEGVLAELRNGLSKLVSEFAEYQEDLGLTAMDIRGAKEAVMRGKNQESEKKEGKGGEKQGEGEQMAERKRDQRSDRGTTGKERAAGGRGQERR